MRGKTWRTWNFGLETAFEAAEDLKEAVMGFKCPTEAISGTFCGMATNVLYLVVSIIEAAIRVVSYASCSCLFISTGYLTGNSHTR